MSRWTVVVRDQQLGSKIYQNMTKGRRPTVKIEGGVVDIYTRDKWFRLQQTYHFPYGDMIIDVEVRQIVPILKEASRDIENVAKLYMQFRMQLLLHIAFALLLQRWSLVRVGWELLMKDG